jgi:hypothetical protein
MTMLRRLTAAAVATSCLLLPVSSALASGSDVIRDCNDNGHLTKSYSQKEYRDALAQMPADIRQYTDCESVIRRAQLGLANSTGGTASVQNPFGDATPEETAAAQKDIATAKASGGAKQRIAGALVTPGTLAYTKLSSVSELPTPLLVLVVLIVLGTLGFAVNLVRQRRGRPGDPGA